MSAKNKQKNYLYNFFDFLNISDNIMVHDYVNFFKILYMFFYKPNNIQGLDLICLYLCQIF